MSSLGKRTSPSSPCFESAPPSSASKRTKTSLKAILDLDDVDVSILPHDELVSHFTTLQTAYKAIEEQLEQESRKKAPLATSTATNAAENWNDEQIAQKASQVGTIACKAIKASMKWTAACKQGTARWQYSGVVPAQSVFYKLFDLPIPTKKKDMWKQKKLPTETFHKAIGHPQGASRWGSWGVTGDTFTVKWAADENSFTLSGTYGL